MFDFPNDSHLLSTIAQGYGGWTGNVMLHDKSQIPGLPTVAKEPEKTRKTSLQPQKQNSTKVSLRPATAKGRLETKECVKVVISGRPASSRVEEKVAKNVSPTPGKPDLTPYKEKFQILPSYRPQIFPSKTYLTRQGAMLLYAVRDQRRDEEAPLEFIENKSRSRPKSAVLKGKISPANEFKSKESVRTNQDSDTKKTRPKSAPPANLTSEADRSKSEAELFAELKSQIRAGSGKKQNRPNSAKKKKRSASARKRKKSSKVLVAEDTPPLEESGMSVDGVGEFMEVSERREDPRRARLREMAEKRRAEMEEMRRRMRSELSQQTEEIPDEPIECLDDLIVTESSCSHLEADISLVDLEKKVSSHSLISEDNSLSDLLANQIAEQKRLEAERIAEELRRQKEELARFELEAKLLRESEESRLREERERQLLEEEKRQQLLADWLDYQNEIKKERMDSLSKAYNRCSSFAQVSRAYTFSYFQTVKCEKPRNSHAKKERRT